MPLRRLATAALALLAAACATSPEFDTGGADPTFTPAAAAAREAVGARVIWGGVVQRGRNEPDRTLLEVVGYPLDDDRRPQTEAQPVGRFLLEREGYLELADYGTGRLVTAVGPVVRVETGKVGEASYRYPVVRAEQLHTWSTGTRRSEPSVHFGIGVVIGR